MLYVAGIEFRKNIERLIDGYGLTGARFRAAHQLVITCRMLPEERDHLLACAAGAGLAGRRPDPHRLRHRTPSSRRSTGPAQLFVFASFYEGSGLPMLEAMACGVAGRGEQHRRPSPEILGDDEGHVRPVRPRRHRARARGHARGRGAAWSGCASARASASRTTRGSTSPSARCDGLRARAGARVALGGRRARRRVASRCSRPWPPEPSGIAELQPPARRASSASTVDVDVVVGGNPSSVRAAAGAGRRARARRRHRLDGRRCARYDRVVYCMGNSQLPRLRLRGAARAAPAWSSPTTCG